ncbi:hypothetical protein SteCoe_33225 [Stentor coeruleus]|uniref:Mitochondrial carrier protein n=1 Tax=Stentor coeruleus TaxID=5963 RepID=A0A1R2AX85_9CILI|nr:hypothetical protein SteCoe_33225 [Stentor coeruleus]
MEKSHSFYPSFLSGGLAGAAIDLTLHPLDYIKTRQHRNQKLDVKARAFYKGLSAALLSSFPCAATFWGCYMASKQYMLSKDYSLAKVETFSSVNASLACCIVRNPFERVKQLVQIGDNIKVRKAISGILKEGGVKGFYKGFSALCVREIPFDTIQMLIFQTLNYAALMDFGNMNYFLYGGIAGGITAYVTSPIDVVKTRMMTNASQYQSFLQTFALIYKNEGIRAFWKGWIARVVYISLGGMLYFGVFNTAFKSLSQSNL